MVIPDLEIPGKTAIPWKKPIASAIQNDTSFGILLPAGKKSTTKSRMPVIKSPTPGASRLALAVTTTFCKSRPTTAVGMVETTISRINLR